MGNIVCCVQKSPLEEIDSTEEIYIRETIQLFYRKMVPNEKLYKLMRKYFSINILDIDGLPLEWIEEQNYKLFVSELFNINDEVNSNILSYIKLEYNSIGNISKELCGGPHVKNTKELGHFHIKKEEASSAGVRRIKAVLE